MGIGKRMVGRSSILGLLVLALAMGVVAAPVSAGASDPVLAYSTFLGGSDDGETGTAIAVDAAGNTYVVGHTFSEDFPTTAGLDGDLGPPSDAFVTKFSPSGTFVWSTHLGGSDFDSARAVAVDGGGNVYVIGATGSLDFPTTAGMDASLGGEVDGFVTKFGPSGPWPGPPIWAEGTATEARESPSMREAACT